jgi:hypothetical protein
LSKYFTKAGSIMYPSTILRCARILRISQADAEEVNSSTGKQRRFDISSAHGYAALSPEIPSYVGYVYRNKPKPLES